MEAPYTKRELRKVAKRYAYYKNLADGTYVGTPNAKRTIADVYNVMDTLGLLEQWYPLVEEELKKLTKNNNHG